MDWFDSDYYHVLYKNRDYSDGKPIQGIEYDENGKSTMWVH